MIGSLALALLAVQESHTADRAAFAARYDLAGLEFKAAPDATLRLGAVELRRGDVRLALVAAAPRHDGAFTLFERAPGVLERFERSAAGVEHSLVIDGPLGGDGDLVVRVELGGTNAALGQRRADGSHSFGSISYGRLFGIDADGERTDGDVRLVPGGLELVIDDAWLDAAAWPITLDPLIAPALVVTAADPVSTLTGEGELDDDPEAAYDVTNGRYLLAWVRTDIQEVSSPFGSGLVSTNSVRAQRLTGGGLVSGALVEVSAAEARAPRVANVARRDRFAVSWLEELGDGEALRLRLVDADDTALSASLLITSIGDGEIRDHDIAGESSLSSGVVSRAYPIWIDAAGDVRFARVDVPASGAPTLLGTSTIAADPGPLDEWIEVSIARCTNADGQLVVALVRESVIANTRRVFALTIERDGTIVTPPLLVSGSDAHASHVSVDGGGSNPSRWVAAWDESSGGLINPTYTLHAVALTGGNAPATLLAGAVESHGTSFARFEPSVGWRPGMAIVAFARPLTDDISVCMLCDATATIGEAQSTAFDWPDTASTDYDTSDAIVALRSSGGDTSAHEGLLLCRREASSVISTQSVIAVRRYDAFDPNATTSSVASGCGNVGAIDVPTPPAIGNPDFRIELTGAKPGAAIAILNIAAPAPLATCGPCSFAALETLFILPIVGGEATKALPIPCNAALAGAQADVQWIVYEPGVAPCTPVPDFGATGVLRLTLN